MKGNDPHARQKADLMSESGLLKEVRLRICLFKEVVSTPTCSSL